MSVFDEPWSSAASKSGVLGGTGGVVSIVSDSGADAGLALPAPSYCTMVMLCWPCVSGVPIPKLLLQEIVSYYSKTRENPAGINLDDPFALPAGIREIQVERGQAIVVQ